MARSPLNDRAAAAVIIVHDLADLMYDRRLEQALGLLVDVKNDLLEQLPEEDGK